MTTSDPTSLLILRAAESLLDEGGPEAVTVRSVADRANIGKSTIAHHYGSKAGLFDAIYLRVCWHLFDLISDQGTTTVEPPSTRYDAECDAGYDAECDAMASFVRDRPGLARLLRSWECPELGDEGDAIVTKLFPGVAGLPCDAATFVLTSAIALEEFRLKLPSRPDDHKTETTPHDLYPALLAAVRGLRGRRR